MSSNAKKKQLGRARRHRRVRKKVEGTPQRPRLAVFRSARHIVVQAIDDINGVTLAAASTHEAGFEGYGGNVEAASKIGALIAERAKAAGIDRVVFDRGGNRYHGRVKAVAESAREGGLDF